MIIPVKGSQPYEIVLESGALAKAGQWLDLNRKVLVVTDSGVPKEYAETVAARCREAVTVTIPQGEKSKNLDTFRDLLKTMLDHDFTRRDCVLAVGGGVVGDLAGFTASCYMRGVDFYNIPTTLLSQVDSSVGGKTAVDFENVKNAVGAFYPPKKVLIDPELLKTLDERQLAAGMAEVIKMAATNDGKLFEDLEACTDLTAALPDFIARALAIKIAVVEEDPKEQGLRRVLNFGHTVGHAIESTENGKFLHGECVALGMLPMASASVRERLKKTLKKYGLPTEYTARADVLAPTLNHDKKKIDAAIRVVLVEKIGSFVLTDMLPEEILKRAEATL